MAKELKSGRGRIVLSETKELLEQELADIKRDDRDEKGRFKRKQQSGDAGQTRQTPFLI